MKAGNKRRVYSCSAVRHKDVVTVVELTEPCPDRPLPRSSGIPGHAKARTEAEMKVVLNSPVGTWQASCSRRTGIRQEARRVKQAVAGRVTERGVKRRLVKDRELIIILVRIREIRVTYPEV